MIGMKLNKHDLSEKININIDEDVKNMDIRLLLKQLENGLEFAEFELEYIESEVAFLKELKEIVLSFNNAINEFAKTKNKDDWKVVIFDGRIHNRVGYDITYNTANVDTNTKLYAKLDRLTKKRLIISTHLE